MDEILSDVDHFYELRWATRELTKFSPIESSEGKVWYIHKTRVMTG